MFIHRFQSCDKFVPSVESKVKTSFTIGGPNEDRMELRTFIGLMSKAGLVDHVLTIAKLSQLFIEAPPYPPTPTSIVPVSKLHTALCTYTWLSTKPSPLGRHIISWHSSATYRSSLPWPMPIVYGHMPLVDAPWAGLHGLCRA